MSSSVPTVPLNGLNVAHLTSGGPGAFAAMLLADYGADVLQIRSRSDPSGLAASEADNPLYRGQFDVELDLGHAAGRAVMASIVESLDVLIVGFRPAALARLELDPETTRQRNPRLLHAAATTWGSTGQGAAWPGHGINGEALSGVLSTLARPGEPPAAPMNLVSVFGAGAMLASAILAALYEREGSGMGQFIDLSMLEATSLLGAALVDRPGLMVSYAGGSSHILQGGSPWYGVYETKDGRHVAVGAIEPRYRVAVLKRAGMDTALAGDGRAEYVHDQLAAMFATLTRAEVDERFGRDCCVTAVLDPAEARREPLNVERRAFVDLGGVTQPAPAARFARTPSVLRDRRQEARSADAVLSEFGVPHELIDRLRAERVWSEV